MTSKEVEAQNKQIRSMICSCDDEITKLGKSDSHGAERAMWLWIDRRASLIAAIESIHA